LNEESIEPKMLRVFLLVATTCVCLIFASSCGYVKAGKWLDDPGNWERAFGEAPPVDVLVLNSLYWRYPHFTYEGGYFIRARVSKASRALIVGNTQLKRLDPSNAEVSGPCEAVPSWFAPKGLKAYEILSWPDNAANQRILVDPNSDEMFFSACQW
jgi:hypothetical protein